MTHDTKTIIVKILTLVVIIEASVGIGIIIGDQGVTTKQPSPVRDLELGTIQEVWDIIHDDYIEADNLDDNELIVGAIRGMLQTLDDPYTSFFSKQEAEIFNEYIGGSFEGIGVMIDSQNDTLTVIAPLKDSPAEKAGIKPQDIIIAVDGNTITGENPDVSIAKIRGPKGSKVTLTIKRDRQQLDIEVTRDTIDIPTIEYINLEGDIAQISIFHFLLNTPSDFDNAVAQAFQEGNKRIILDVRSNPGGFLESATNIADRFFPNGTVIALERSHDNQYKTFVTKREPTLDGVPLVVLQNNGSASASEILVGALQDNNNVPVVGETSFGKGRIQNYGHLSGGTSLKYTVAEWFTPNRTHIDTIGITPTVEIQDDPDTEQDEQLEKAIEIIKGL